jgi:RNA polymerase sigma-70 factor (ECF subfamily)
MTILSHRNEDESHLVDAAISGDRAAKRRLVQSLAPAIRMRVGRGLARRPASRGRNVGQEIDDLTQQVFVVIFSNDARALRAWDRSRGVPLVDYCRLLASREVASVLRSGRRSPWKETAVELDVLEREIGGGSAMQLRIESIDELSQLVTHLRAILSPRALDMFRRLFIRDDSVAHICEATGMSPPSVYAWRSRLAKLAREVLRALNAGAPTLA